MSEIEPTIINELQDEPHPSSTPPNQPNILDFLKTGLVYRTAENRNQPTLLAHIILSTVLIILVLTIYLGLFKFANGIQSQWLLTPQPIAQEQVEATITNIAPLESEKIRMIQQFRDVENKSALHARIMGFFYKQYYLSISMISGAVVIASLCIFFISKVGWDDANNALINIFIVALVVVILFGNLSFNFKQEDNLIGNQELYLKYCGLRNEILSYWTTKQNINGATVEPVQFIHYVDQKMQALNDIRLGFDSRRIINVVDRFNQMIEPQKNGQ